MPTKRSTAAKPIEAPRRASILRDEITNIEGLMFELGIKDRRTALKMLRTLGLPVAPVAGIVLVSGEAFFQAVQNLGASHETK